jgi:uncharacterized protein (TIGR03089 family)
VTKLISDQLRRRVRDLGSAPLLTYYDLDSGQRTELSAVTFANWVDKTSNLLVDELMVDAGDRIELAVAHTHPGHWVTLVWELACWQVGATVTIGHQPSARLVVSGPDWAAYADASDLVACSLHPLGLGFPAPLPGGVIDYALEVRGQPDSYAATPQSGLALAWLDAEHQLTQADLVTGDTEPARRRLVRPSDPWTTARLAVVDPVRTGGSAVVVTGTGAAGEQMRIRDQEQVDPD